MRTALIGHTGFVGSNIAAARPFDDYYNTTNIAQLEGREYGLVVSAAARADSHRINNEAAQDRAEIDDFVALLSTARIDRLVLVSTVCVYPGRTSPDENTALTADGLTPYGANRLHMEQALAQRFDTLALRLPQLYGLGMKKGIVHDLLNDHRVEYIRPDGRFQYYDLRRLWSDAQIADAAGLSALNLATPALTSAAVARECFGRDIDAQTVEGTESPFASMYTRDMRTAHADLFGGPAGYLLDAAAEMAALRAFVATERGGPDTPTRTG